MSGQEDGQGLFLFLHSFLLLILMSFAQTKIHRTVQFRLLMTLLQNQVNIHLNHLLLFYPLHQLIVLHCLHVLEGVPVYPTTIGLWDTRFLIRVHRLLFLQETSLHIILAVVMHHHHFLHTLKIMAGDREAAGAEYPVDLVSQSMVCMTMMVETRISCLLF